MIVEDPLYKVPQKMKLREILLQMYMGPQKIKKMNKHFYMTPLKMKRKATFLYGFTKNESKENPIIWLNQK